MDGRTISYERREWTNLALFASLLPNSQLQITRMPSYYNSITCSSLQKHSIEQSKHYNYVLELL
jgi:hypothetical protein